VKKIKAKTELFVFTLLLILVVYFCCVLAAENSLFCLSFLVFTVYLILVVFAVF